MVQDLRRIVSQHPSYPDPLFFYPGTVADGETFFSRFWPEARAVSDPDGRFYRAFGLGSGSLRELFGPGVWIRGMQAALKGSGVSRPVGNPWLMPGLFLVDHDHILWQYRCRHAGDHPDLARIAEHVTPGP